MEIWAFSLMELGILLLVILWSIQNLVRGSELGVRSLKFEILMICLFLILICFQIGSFKQSERGITGEIR
jgi:hypothetical protein